MLHFILFQCYATDCLDVSAHLSATKRSTLLCDHLKQAQAANEAKEFADKKFVDTKDLEKVLKNVKDLDIFSSASSDGRIPVYILPGENHVVPSMSHKSYESPLQLIHLRRNKCPLLSCKEKRSKLHTLTKKDQYLCPHNLLCHLVKDLSSDESSEPRVRVPKLNRDLSITFVVKQIQEQFPSFSSARSDDFLAKSRKYAEKLFCNPLRNGIIDKKIPQFCQFCKDKLLDWPFKPKKAFLLSMGHMKQIEIKLKICPSCKRVFYPGKYLLY